MVVSFQGGERGGGVGDGAEGAATALILRNFNQKKYTGPTDQLEKSINDISRNGFRAPLALQRLVLFLPLFHLYQSCC